MSDLKVGDKVRLKDWRTVREGSTYGSEYYTKLAYPNQTYIIEHITPLLEVYMVGVTNYFRYNLLELC